MWRFIKNILSSTIGTLLALFVFLIFIISIAVSSNITIPEESDVLRIDLFNPLVEHANPSPLDDLDIPFQLSSKKDGVFELVTTINAASNDTNIKGIYVRCSNIQSGFASIKELRDAFQRFKDKGKWVCFHSNSLAENALYLSSVGTSFVSPSGNVEFNGLNTELMFFKNMLNKLGIESKIYRVGKFKSAIEPFIADKMSDENRKQISTLQESLYTSILDDISSSKGIKKEELRRFSDNMTARTVDQAVSIGIIDGAKYEDEVFTYIQNLLGQKDESTLEFKNWKTYHQTLSSDESSSKVAVLMAQGEIVSGTDLGDGKKIGSATLIEQIRDVKNDDEVKAVVLRINSPGGSALASDIIWRELELLKRKKPVIASMGDLAASGGYYIAMGCDKIVASPNTITGSIGVFGIMFNLEDFLNNKIGLTFDRVQTGEFSSIPSFTRKMSAAEDSIIQSEVERIYEDFISKAAKGRSLTKSQIHEIAQGRIWSAQDAISNHLIDTLGGLQDAVLLSAEKANLSDYEISIYPKETGFLSKLGLSAEQEVKSELGEELGDTYTKIKSLKDIRGYQMRSPFWINIE